MPDLLLLRHGQSQWNLENRFTDWIDVPLAPRGEAEARAAGEKLRGRRIDKLFTSVLVRATETARLQERPRGRARELAAGPRHAPGRAHPRAGAGARDPDRRAAAVRARGRRDGAREALPVSMLLRDRRIIVTGGASGIAAATVRGYAREGARVAALDVNDEGGRRVAAEAGPSVTYYHWGSSQRAEGEDRIAR